MKGRLTRGRELLPPLIKEKRRREEKILHEKKKQMTTDVDDCYNPSAREQPLPELGDQLAIRPANDVRLPGIDSDHIVSLGGGDIGKERIMIS